jgi:hypothetical protein
MGRFEIRARLHLAAVRAGIASVAALALVCALPLPAHADGASALGTQVVPGANAAIKYALHADATPSPGSGASSNAYPKIPAGAQAGLPVGFSYTADISAAHPFGDVGSYGKRWLPGGVDLVASYGFSPTVRVAASYYEVQHYPVGFDSGIVPLFIQGLAPPVGTVDLSTTNIDATTKDRFTIFNVSKLFRLGKLPIVVTPTYVSRNSTVGKGPQDIVAFWYKGFPRFGINTRTAQYDSLAITLPFLSTPKMFGTFTAAPTWLTHRNGLNQDNRAQIYQILYVEYNLDARTKFFYQPQSSRDYLPADVYPQHIASYFLGASERFGKNGFVQLVLNSGSPTNYRPYGVYGLHCLATPCSQNPVIPQIGGLKATQLQFQIGLGSPSVLPF